MKKTIEKRWLYLYSGECVASVLFIFVSYSLNWANPDLQLYSFSSFWASFILLEFLLLQGSMYWYSKWKALRKENTSVTPIGMVRLLSRFKAVNLVLLPVPTIAFVLDFREWYPSTPAPGMFIALFVYAFAVLEYINYFHIQLSYDNRSDLHYLLKHKKLKQACIKKDLKRIS